MTLPTTQHELYLWNGLLFIGYGAVAFMLDLIYRKFFGQRAEVSGKPSEWLFNAAAFSASSMVGLGFYDDNVMRLIGDTTGYLIIGVGAGFGYSVFALLPHGWKPGS